MQIQNHIIPVKKYSNKHVHMHADAQLIGCVGGGSAESFPRTHSIVIEIIVNWPLSNRT